jgi:dCMP deaminase
MIINAGITRVVCEKRYHADKDSIDIFKQTGIDLEVIENEILKYDNQ